MARAGYDVTVVEQNDKPGWRANLLERDWYRRDMWPSRYLMPDAFERYFHAIGRKVEDYLDLQKLEPSYRVFFKDDISWKILANKNSWAPYLDLYADVEKTAEQFEQIEHGSGDKLRKYLSSAAEQYDIAMNKFVFKNVDSIREVMKPEMAIDGMKLNIFSSLYNYVSRFVKTENLKKILMYPSVFLGTSPYETPALFNIMSHVDFNQWVFYPQWGIHQIPQALYQIALDEWVRFEFDTAVEKIVIEDRKVVWIQLKNNNIKWFVYDYKFDQEYIDIILNSNLFGLINTKPQDVTRATTGVSAKVFIIDHQFVLKVYQNKEEYQNSLNDQSGTMLYSSDFVAEFWNPVMIFKFIEGNGLDHIYLDFDDQQKQESCSKIIQLMRYTHGTKTIWLYNTTILFNKLKYFAGRMDDSLSQNIKDKISHVLESYQCKEYEWEMSLIHNDIQFENIIVSDDEFTLIDRGDCIKGPIWLETIKPIHSCVASQLFYKRGKWKSKNSVVDLLNMIYIWYPELFNEKYREEIELLVCIAMIRKGKETAELIYQYVFDSDNIIYSTWETPYNIKIISDKKIMPADIIISNADMRHTETKLLEPAQQTYPESYRAKKVISPSWFILYLWVDGELPQLQHHTLIFNDDRKEGFAQVFSKPQRPNDPSYYICNPSKTDPTVAPDGKENLFVLVPIAPWLESTPESLQAYADFILADISRTCGITDLAERIEVQQIFSIPQFEQYYNAYKGTALGLAHTMFQSAFWRPSNYSKKVKWLYYAWGYTTPGIGMPMCLISALMVAERIEKNEK